MNRSTEVFSWIDQHRDRAIALFQELVQIPSVWGDTKYLSMAAQKLKTSLEESGVDVRLTPSGSEGAPNVYARLAGSGGGPALLFLAHLDVYPPCNGWSVDPFGGVIREGRLYGQGAADMKAGLCAMVAAGKFLKEMGVSLKGDVILLAVPNHFEGGEGTRVALRDGLRADYGIVCEPTDLKVVVGQRGILYATITTKGRSAHTTAQHIAVNAVEWMIPVLQGLDTLRRETVPGTSEPKYIINPAMVEGGIRRNLVPDVCRLTVDIRYAPSETMESTLAAVERMLTRIERLGSPIQFEVTVEPTCVRNRRNPTLISSDHPLVKLVKQSHQVASGKKAVEAIHPAWPDTPVLNEAGIPALTYGPGSMLCYWPDEYVDLEEYITAIKSYVHAAMTLCGDCAVEHP